MAEAPGLGAGVDDVRAVGEAVNDGLGEAGVGEDLGPFAEGQVGGDDQRAAFVALGEDLEDELGGAVGQREVAELVNDDELGAGVAGNDAGELAADWASWSSLASPARVVKRTRRPCWQAQTASAVASIVLPVPLSPMKITLSRSVIQEPSASAAIVAWGTVGVVGEDEVFEAFDLREARVDQAPAFAAFGAFLVSRPPAARRGRRPGSAARAAPPRRARGSAGGRSGA